MKLLLCALLTLTFSQTTFAATVVKGVEARSIMEALTASGFKLQANDGEWSGQTLKISTKAITCRYTFSIFPDQWMGNVKCNKGTLPATSNFLKESLGLAKAIEKFASPDAAGGTAYIGVQSIECSLVYDSKEYECTIAE